MVNRKRSKQIAVRVTEEEYAEIMKQVEKSGMTQQDFFLKAIRETKIINTDGLNIFRAELKRIGTNLNQIAKSCNEGNQATAQEVASIGKEMNEVWQQLKRYIAEQA